MEAKAGIAEKRGKSIGKLIPEIPEGTVEFGCK
jgi:hypothetical protein